MNSNLTSIKYISVFPVRQDRWKYYINDNFKDSHSIKTDELKRFINSKITHPAINDVVKMISQYFNFIVDVENNKVFRLFPKVGVNDIMLKDKTINKFLNSKIALNDHKKRNEVIENKYYNKENSNILDKYVIMENS